MSSAGIPAPCLDCANAAMLTHGRCPDCLREHRRTEARASYARNGRRQRPERELQQGAWKRASKRAREMQPWCLDCQRDESQLEPHERLEFDHSPAQWDRLLRGLPIRLDLGDVLCSTCNVQRGDAKPGSRRWAEWQAQQAVSA